MNECKLVKYNEEMIYILSAVDHYLTGNQCWLTNTMNNIFRDTNILKGTVSVKRPFIYGMSDTQRFPCRPCLQVSVFIILKILHFSGF